MADTNRDRVLPFSWFTLLWIGLIAGTLDIGENLIYNHFRAVTPTMVFQYIASGLIGMASFQMGGTSVAMGVVIHYLIALTWTAIFYVASRRMAVLRERAVISGLLYGVLVYVVMTFVVLPLTRVPPPRHPPTLANRINALLPLLFCIGLTISLLVRWSEKRFRE
jgi:uncharacterized membrane protein YagU involved in acid resistance